MLPGSQEVPGSAPIITNSAAAGTVSVAPLTRCRSVRVSRLHWPWPPVTSVDGRTRMLAVLLISVTR